MRRLLIVVAVALFVIGAVLYSTGRVSEGVVVILLSAAAVTVFTLLGMLDDARGGRAEKRDRKAATPGVGRVLEIRPNGRYHDGSALHDVILSVELPGREPYVATVESKSWLYLYEGKVTPVRVSASDPQRVWIEYDPGFEARSRM